MEYRGCAKKHLTGLVGRSLCVLSLKAAVMGLSLSLVEISYRILSSSDFVTFNGVLFGVGLTATYYFPLHVAIWHKDSKTSGNLLASTTILSLIVLPAYGHLGLNSTSLPPVILAAGTLVYGLYKAWDRVAFNLFLTHCSPLRAYICTLTFLCLEVVSFVLLCRVAGAGTPLMSRLFWCGLVLLLGVTGVLLYALRLRAWIGTPRPSADCFAIPFKGENLLVSASSLLLVVTTLGDRFLAAWLDLAPEQCADYLLYSAYAGAIHTFFASAVEFFRPRLFDKLAEAGYAALASIRWETVWVTTVIVVGFVCLGGVVFTYMWLRQPAVASAMAGNWCLLCIGFCCYEVVSLWLLLSYFTKSYHHGLVTWSCGLATKATVLVFLQSAFGLALSTALSGVVAVFVTLLLHCRLSHRVSTESRVLGGRQASVWRVATSEEPSNE